MLGFLQAYGDWIVAGLLLLMMLRMHGRRGGIGCGMGCHDHQVGNRDRVSTEEPDSRGDSQGLNEDGSCH